MTAHKHLKQLIRARMEKTGERYAAARRQILGSEHIPALPANAQSHFPGSIPGATALRGLLAHAGVRAPHTGKPFTEAMTFGLAGGIGIGVFSFYYEKGDFASFFIGGRHQWHDDRAYLGDALQAFGIKPAIQETSGAKIAARNLAEAVAENQPCVAWVDGAGLPHRGIPKSQEGMMYHIVTIYDVDEEKKTALIGDLTDLPISIGLTDLTAARGRIKKDKFRLLSIPSGNPPRLDLRALVKDGLRRCHHVLLHPTLPQAQNNGRLEALKTWADRLTSTKDPLRWERIFRPGLNLWRGLNWVESFIEYYGTGGGLCRPIMADFLEEAATAVSWPALTELAARYRELGRQWSQLADSAVPESVPAFRQAKELRTCLGQLRHDGTSPEQSLETSEKLATLEREFKTNFPLSAKECADLRADLSARVLQLYDGEVAALKELEKLAR